MSPSWPRPHSLSLSLSLAVFLGIATTECHRPTLSATEQHGQEIYARTCAVCHGPNGEGYAADQAPALAHPDFLASVSDDFLRSVITSGRSGTTMSAWGTAHGGPLSPSDVDAVIARLHAWSRAPRAVLDERPVAGDISSGIGFYSTHCSSCHGTNGMNGTNIHIGNHDLLASASNGFLRYAIVRGRPGTAMPAFAGVIGDEGIENVVALLRSWATAPAPIQRPPPVSPLPLGPVPLNPHGPVPDGFARTPKTTPADTVKAQLDRGARMAILDARAPQDYVNEHIAGAVSVPFYDPDRYFPDLPKDAWLVCYCSCPHAESGQLATKLLNAGFTKVTVLDEGLG
ncbi:MAG TPA: c-type cytochrome, partial [Candidatus Tumulicola sp.]|nr:c-type cytochrome [Candidatus Tumulicola sp.]